MSVPAFLSPGGVRSVPTCVTSDTGVRTVLRVIEPIHSVSEPHPVSRRGKVPPIDPFDGKTAGVTFEDCLLTLQRAAAWNGWTEDDSLVQLAGYLRTAGVELPHR